MLRKAVIPVLSIVLLVTLFGLFLPAYIRARNTKASNLCVSNLRMIEAAKSQWALENHKTANDPVSMSDIQPYMGRGELGEIPVCPDGGTYIAGKVGEPPRCSLGGPQHTLDYYSTKEAATERFYERATFSVAALSGLGLVVALSTKGPRPLWLRCMTALAHRR